MHRALRYSALCAVAVLLLVASSFFVFQKLSLPSREGVRFVPGLAASVDVIFDDRAIPRINAGSRDDAFAALGYFTAGDRLFQMDLLRRRASGRLAEIFGEAMIELDKEQRTLGLERVAREILVRLKAEQRSTLNAYVAGVNRAMQDSQAWPLEFYLLRYQPEAWRPEDSILALLGMEQLISNTMYQERTASVMRRALDDQVFSFLTPDTDCFNERLAPSNPARCAKDAAPIDALKALVQHGRRGRPSGAESHAAGSNAWVVSGKRTRDGRAILANDMHLELSVPNVWYRAELNYGSIRLAGLTMPGLPMLLTGSNGKVAWGFTNSKADVVDLVTLTQDPSIPDAYRVAGGYRRFATRVENIAVRGREDVNFDVKGTIWGPVSAQKLLGQDVAMHWTLLDPAATNLDVLDMDRVNSVAEAVELFHRAGVAPLNVLLADERGDIAWTLTGRLPKRNGVSGLYSVNWANDGDLGWRGYLAPEDMPSIVNPPSGLLINTNNKMLGDKELPLVIGHEFQGGVRASRALQLLSGSRLLYERDLGDAQLDSSGDYYRYYRDLALRVLDDDPDQESSAIRRYIEAWNGRADTDTLGLPLIQEFIFALKDSVLAPIVARCREIDPEFELNLDSTGRSSQTRDRS